MTERLRADYFAALMQEAASAVPVVTYSLYNRDADVCVERLRLNMEETQVPDTRQHVQGHVVMHPFRAEPHLREHVACLLAERLYHLAKRASCISALQCQSLSFVTQGKWRGIPLPC